MSNTFKLSRLALVLKSHLVEHKQRYLYYLVGMLFIGLIVMLLIVCTAKLGGYGNTYTLKQKHPRVTNWEYIQTGLYLGGLAVFGFIFSSVSFVNFNNKGEAIFYLIKPASQLEKWLTEIIVHVVLFFLAFTLVFYVLDIPMTILVRSLEYSHYMSEFKDWTPEEQREYLFHSSDFFHFSTLHETTPLLYPGLISLYLTGTAFFMYGAVLFNRFSFFKTLFLAFITGMVYVAYSIFLFKDAQLAFAPKGWTMNSFLKASYYTDGKHLAVELSENWGWFALYFLMAFVPLVLFACSYLKLKEKEV